MRLRIAVLALLCAGAGSEGRRFPHTGELATDLCNAAARGLRDMRWDRGGTRPGYVERRLERCRGLVDVAGGEGHDEAFMARVVAIAYNESNFRPRAIGSAGERGMMQVQPKWHCWRALGLDSRKEWSGEPCDYRLAGIRALAAFVEADRAEGDGREDWLRVLKGYNGSWDYAYTVDGYARSILRRWSYRQRLHEG